MPATNLGVSANILWKVMESSGHDPDPLFRAEGIEPAMLRSPDARIPAQTIDRLVKRAMDVLPDPCIGLKAVQYWHPSNFGPLGYAWLASSSLRSALLRLQRYLKLVTGIMTVALEESRDGLTVTFAAKPGYQDLAPRYDFFAGLLVRMCRMNFGDVLVPVHVTFTHESYPCCQSYGKYFRCPVQFDAATNSVNFATEDVDKELASGHPQLAQVHDQIIVRYIAALDRSDIVQRAKSAILDRLQSGAVSDDDVAQALHVSIRTLQRKLSDAGTSFRELVDETRRELAQAYIRDRSVSLSELAFMLGFSDASAFSRAYKRWTGKAPREARMA